MMSCDMMLHVRVIIRIFVALPTVLYLLVQYSKCRGDTADTEIIFIYLRHLGRFIHLVGMNACTYYLVHIQVYIKFAASMHKLAVGTFNEAVLEPSCSLFLNKNYQPFFVFRLAVTSMRINIQMRQREKKLQTPVMQLYKSQVSS